MLRKAVSEILIFAASAFFVKQRRHRARAKIVKSFFIFFLLLIKKNYAKDIMICQYLKDNSILFPWRTGLTEYFESGEGGGKAIFG
jgi:hypothetical protein